MIARRRLSLVVLVVVALVAPVAGCATDDADVEPSSPPDAVRIGAFNFPESELLAEIYAQALEAEGIPVERLGPIGPREVVEPALQLDLVDVVPEYAGTMLQFVTLGAVEPTPDPERTVRELREALGSQGIVVLDPSEAQNRNEVVVTRSLASELGLVVVSDLEPVAGSLTIGGPPECPERPFCLLGLRDEYGLEFASFVPLPSSAVVAESLRMGQVDVGVMFSTDPAMVDPDLTLLDDDRSLQPAENVVPVVRWGSFFQWAPELGDALNAVSARLYTLDLALLNLQARDSGADIAELAARWLAS